MTTPLRRIDAGPVAKLALAGGVIKASMLASADAAHGIVEQAQHEAARLLDAAQARAKNELQWQQLELEQRVWRHAADYAEAVGREWELSLAELEAGIAETLGRALRRLVEEVPANERLRACVQQLLARARAPDTGVLMVSEQDHATVLALADTLPWPVQASIEVPAGSVRLVSAHGRWECDVDGALERLLEALGASTGTHTENGDD